MSLLIRDTAMTIEKGHTMKISQRVIRSLCLFGLWLGLGLQAHAQTDTVTYVYTDPQGTPLVKADASGNVVTRYDYTPYGNSVASLGSPPNGPGYIGHVNDPETGLVYMQARYYQPTGRFLSPDPAGPSPGNVYGFNRYAYANNNPIANSDLDGRSSQDDVCMGNMECESTYGGGDPYSGHFYVQDRIADAVQQGQAQDQQAIAAAAPYVQGAGSLIPGVSLFQCSVNGCSGTDWVLAAIAVIPLEGEAGTAAKALEKVADATRGETETVYRWMSKAELKATQRTGLLRGGRNGTHYVTDAANRDPLRARMRTSLPNTPEVRVKLEVPAGTFSSPSRVEPAFNMPGGGMERTATGNVPVNVLETH